MAVEAVISLVGALILAGGVMVWIGLLTKTVKNNAIELNENKTQLQAVLDVILSGVIVIDQYGTIQSVNPAVSKLFGYKKTEMIHKNVNMLMPEPYHSEHNGYLERYKKTGIKKVIGIGRDVEGRKKDGTLFPVNLAVGEMTIEGDRYFVGVLTDVSHRKRMEEQYRNLFETMTSGIFAIDPETFRTQRPNPALCRLLGCSPQEIENKTLLDFHTPEEQSKMTALYEQVCKQELEILSDISFVRRNGEQLIADMVFSHHQFEGKSWLIAFITDVTRQKEDKERLGNLTTRLLLATEAAQVGVWDWNVLDNSLIWDDTMYDIYGVDKNTFSGAYEAWQQSVHPDDIQQSEAKLAKCLTDGIDFDDQFRVVWPNGDIRIIKARARVKKDGVGDVVQMIGVNWDVTESEQAKKLLEQAKEAAESAAKAKSLFLANMSHEIRSPMNSVLGFLNIVTESPHLPADLKDYLETAYASANSLLIIINDILDFSKLESGRFSLERTPFNLKSSIERVLQAIDYGAREKGIELCLEFDDRLASCYVGDPTRLRQIITNLVGNAVKFTEAGRVTVAVEPETTAKGILKFKVADTGIGMATKQIESIFSSFTQADTSTARRFGGTGLGLAISRQIVELMEGKIWVESEPGIGSTFYFTACLPEASDQTVCLQDGLYADHETYNSPRKFNILMVEDVPENARLASLNLEKQGHQVTWVQNGKEAVEAVKKTVFDLALMDVMMPVMDGLSATRKIRENEAAGEQRMPIIALTASILKEERERCLRNDMDAVVGKPINFSELYRVMEQVVTDDRGLAVSEPVKEKKIPDMTDLSGIAGIADLTKALAMWKDADVYAQSLVSFIKTHGKDAKMIADHRVRQDQSEVKKILHTLKGTAANLALKDITHRVAMIEEQLNTRDRGLINESIEALAVLLRKSSEAILQLEVLEEENEILKAFDADQFETLLKVLRDKLPQSNPDLVEPVFEKLSMMISARHLSGIRNAVNAFDFEQALEEVDRLESIRKDF